MLYFALITLHIAKKYVFSSGGSEKNRLITGADVRTGDLLPSRMRVAVLSTGQRLRRRRTVGCWPMCQRGAAYCTPVTCFLRENVGGSEKNRLITGAVDYCIWGLMQQRLYKTPVRDTIDLGLELTCNVS